MSNPSSDKADAERVVSNDEIAPGKDGEATHAHGESGVADLAQATRRGLRAPEIIARLSPEQRIELETRLRRKVDLRLLPMIIIMCPLPFRLVKHY